ncbi:MAG: hypothetical protein NTV23_02535 [Propionibacteriales bacterium]|nr:hypothetical protein [Propionibacteriales bacterium]
MSPDDDREHSSEVAAAGRAFRRACRGRRVHPTTVVLGLFRGVHVVLPDADGLDGGLRTDLVEQVLSTHETVPALVRITRGGALWPSDTDFAWYAAANHGFGRHGRQLESFAVITREGWFDLVTDHRERW